MRLGKINVDKMLRRLTARQFAEWEAYARIEPFNELRQDYRIASICQILANINRGKRQRPYLLDDFLLKFGGEAEEKPPQQSWQQQKSIAQLIVDAYSAPGVNNT